MDELADLQPGEVGWVCRCGAELPHPLVKGAWNVAEDACPKRLPAFRMKPEQVAERVSVDVAAEPDIFELNRAPDPTEGPIFLDVEPALG